MGIVAAAAAFIFTQYEVSFSPFSLEERSNPSYIAASELLVTSSNDPFLRTTETSVLSQTIPGGPRNQPGQETGAQQDQQTGGLPPGSSRQIITDRPDSGVLIQAANVYPMFIESDEIAELRTTMFGELRGTVDAVAPFSVNNTSDGFRSSPFPVVQIGATAPTRAEAVQLAFATTQAFKRWIVLEQDEAEIPPKQRVYLEVLKSPGETVEIGASSWELPAVAAGGALLAFIVLALVLDRAFPRKPPVRFAFASEGGSPALRVMPSNGGTDGREAAPAETVRNGQTLVSGESQRSP